MIKIIFASSGALASAILLDGFEGDSSGLSAAQIFARRAEKGRQLLKKLWAQPTTLAQYNDILGGIRDAVSKDDAKGITKYLAQDIDPSINNNDACYICLCYLLSIGQFPLALQFVFELRSGDVDFFEEDSCAIHSSLKSFEDDFSRFVSDLRARGIQPGLPVVPAGAIGRFFNAYQSNGTDNSGTDDSSLPSSEDDFMPVAAEIIEKEYGVIAAAAAAAVVQAVEKAHVDGAVSTAARVMEGKFDAASNKISVTLKNKKIGIIGLKSGRKREIDSTLEDVVQVVSNKDFIALRNKKN